MGKKRIYELSTISYFAMYPSLKRISAIAFFILDAGTSTERRQAWTKLH